MTVSIILTVIGLLMSVYAVIAEHYPIPKLRLWVVLLLLTWAWLGYDVYDHRAGLTLKVAPILAFLGGISALILVSVILNRTKSKEPLAAEAPTENPKKPSKLVIHWANYRAVENAGDVYDVGDFLRQIISGDSLFFDIENHNFVIGDKNFVPRDPAPFKEKRLQVNYSYGGAAPVTTERREHGRLLLPEDSKIQWLTGEVDRLKAAQPKPSQYPVPRLRNKIVVTVSELQGFIREHGDEPVVTKLMGESTTDTALRYIKEGDPWRAKFIGDYRLRFGDSIPKLRDEMRVNVSISDNELNKAIETAANSEEGSCKAVKDIIDRLWTLGRNVNA